MPKNIAPEEAIAYLDSVGLPPAEYAANTEKAKALIREGRILVIDEGGKDFTFTSPENDEEATFVVETLYLND